MSQDERRAADRAKITDPILQVLFDLETEYQADKYWTHYKGFNDLKVAFLRMQAMMKELRSNAHYAPHGETRELPPHVKQYIKEQIYAIQRLLG